LEREVEAEWLREAKRYSEVNQEKWRYVKREKKSSNGCGDICRDICGDVYTIFCMGYTRERAHAYLSGVAATQHKVGLLGVEEGSQHLGKRWWW
jgi:hypothetical protein